MRTVQKEEIQRVIVKREARSYKGDFGRLLLIGGTYPYGGAIIMAALAAVHSGAGLVTVATDPDNLTALHSHLPEASPHIKGYLLFLSGVYFQCSLLML